MPLETSLRRIQLCGKVARYIALLIMVVVPSLHLVLFLTNDFILVNSSSPTWDVLMEHYRNEGALWVMAVAGMPLTLLHVVQLHWFSRLFGCYGEGKLLDEQTVHCYILLAWLYAGVQGVKTLFPFLLAFWHQSVLGHFELSLAINPGNLLFAPALLFIAYSLKFACKIQQENREFV